jgi:hypothetical protein
MSQTRYRRALRSVALFTALSAAGCGSGTAPATEPAPDASVATPAPPVAKSKVARGRQIQADMPTGNQMAN